MIEAYNRFSKDGFTTKEFRDLTSEVAGKPMDSFFAKYVDGTEALGDVPYRATTGLIDLPISTTVGIAPANGDVIASFPFALASGGHYVVTASGIVGDADHPFDLVASTLDTAAVDADHFM